MRPPDTVTKVVLETIRDVGYAVTLTETQVTGIDTKTGERFSVRFDVAKNELYDAVVELAQSVGIDLMDR